MFRVQTQVLDLHYHNEAQAPAFQDRARRLYYHAILSEMEAVMAKHDPRESIFRIHKLELDLGEMDEENFDTEWVKRFRERFEEELEKRLRRIRTEKGTAEDSEIPLKKRQIEIFEHYLLHGSLPWNAGDEKLTPRGMAEELLNHHVKDLIRILKKHGSNAKVVQRLVFQLSEKQIVRIIENLQPTEAKVIIETVEKVDHTRRKESFVKTDSVNFRSQLWQLALRYILEDRGSYFNTKEFVKAMLYGIADHFNMERLQLILQFYKAILHLQKAISLSPTLWRILAEVHAETLETQQNPFPFTPTFDQTAAATGPWYEDAVSGTRAYDVSRYTGKPLPFVVPADGFSAGKTKALPGKNTNDITENPNGFTPLGANGKFSENGEITASATAMQDYSDAAAYGNKYNKTETEASQKPGSPSAAQADTPLLEFGLPKPHTSQTNTARTHGSQSEPPQTQPAAANGTLPQTDENVADTPIDPKKDFVPFTLERNTPPGGVYNSNPTANPLPATEAYPYPHDTQGGGGTNPYLPAKENHTHPNGVHGGHGGGAAPSATETHTHAAHVGSDNGHNNGSHTAMPVTEAGVSSDQAYTDAGNTGPSTDYPFHAPPSHAVATDEPAAEVDLAEWVARLDEADMGHVVEHLIFDVHYTDALGVWLWEKGADSGFRRRMGNSIRTVEQFERIVSAMDAPHAPYVAEFSKRLQAEQEEQHLFPVTAVQFRKDQYYVLLTVLLTRRGSYFNKKSFVKQVLVGLAQQYGMDFRQLLERLVLSVPKHMRGLTQLPEILQLLNDLREDEIRVQQTQTSANKKYAPQLIWERLEQWIAHGSQPPQDSKRFGALGGLSFIQLWELLLQSEEADEKHTEHFFGQTKAVRYLAQHLDTDLYEQTLERFVPLHRQQAIRLFATLAEQIRQSAGGSATGMAAAALPLSVSAAEFTRMQREWTLGKIGKSASTAPTRELLLEEVLTFFTEKMGYSPQTLWEKIRTVWQKTFTDAPAAVQFFRRWAQKRGKSLSPAQLPLPDNQTPDTLTHHFLKTWGNASRHSPAFQTEVLRLVQLIGKKGETEVLKFLHRVFTTQTFPEFVYTHAQPDLLAALAHFPVQAYGYFLKAIVQDYRFLLRTASVQLPQAEAELTKAMLHAWFMGERTEKAFVERMLQRLAHGKKTDAKTLRTLLRQQALTQQTELKSKLLLHLSTGEAPLATPATPAAAPKPPVPAKPAVRPPGIPYGNKVADEVLDSIQVNHAGVVLAWPFLTMYFKRLNLTDNNTFTDEAAQHRAVHLLHYLGDTQPAPETDLVLAKILCGMQPGDPITGDFTPTDDEKALAESLLKGILGQWKEVSKTSVETFRDSFLKRQGVLYLKNSGWELHPQTKTFDVLLDKLPWGVQIIKLPWMKTSLFCKWR